MRRNAPRRSRRAASSVRPWVLTSTMSRKWTTCYWPCFRMPAVSSRVTPHSYILIPPWRRLFSLNSNERARPFEGILFSEQR